MDIFQIVRLNEEENYHSLIDKVNINILNEDSQNLLHEAITYKRDTLGLDLINRNININQKDKDGLTPLHYTASYNNFKLAEIIIRKGGDVNICDKHGNNSLWTATFNAKGKYELVVLFIKSGADAFNKNKYGKSAIDFANQIEDEALIRILTNTNKQY